MCRTQISGTVDELWLVLCPLVAFFFPHYKNTFPSFLFLQACGAAHDFGVEAVGRQPSSVFIFCVNLCRNFIHLVCKPNERHSGLVIPTIGSLNVGSKEIGRVTDSLSKKWDAVDGCVRQDKGLRQPGIDRDLKAGFGASAANRRTNPSCKTD